MKLRLKSFMENLHACHKSPWHGRVFYVPQLGTEEAIMNKAIDIEATRARTLLAALRAILQCAQELEEPGDQIASAIFLTTELGDAVERLISIQQNS
jgi:hypothetical protein